MSINYELARKQGPGLKAALTRAKNIADPEKRYIAVRAACTKAVKAWEVWGCWPDAWATWQRTLDDAFYAAQRSADIADRIWDNTSHCPRLEDL